MSEAPEHILISRFHISASPAAPSLVVRLRLGVWRRAHVGSGKCERTCRTAAWTEPYTCMQVSLCCKHGRLSLDAIMHAFVLRIALFPVWWSWRFCHLLVGGGSAPPDQSHVGRRQHCSGISVDELISSLVSVSSALPVFCIVLQVGRKRSIEAQEGRAHELFTVCMKRTRNDLFSSPFHTQTSVQRAQTQQVVWNLLTFYF